MWSCVTRCTHFLEGACRTSSRRWDCWVGGATMKRWAGRETGESRRQRRRSCMRVWTLDKAKTGRDKVKTGQFNVTPPLNKIGLCSSRFSKFDKSTFLWIDTLMVQPKTKSASALPDFRKIRVHFFYIKIWLLWPKSEIFRPTTNRPNYRWVS